MVVCYVSKNYLTEIFHIFQEKSSKFNFCLRKCKQNLPDLCSDFSHVSNDPCPVLVPFWLVNKKSVY